MALNQTWPFQYVFINTCLCRVLEPFGIVILTIYKLWCTLLAPIYVKMCVLRKTLNSIPNHIGKVAFPYANKSGRGAAGS